MSRTLSQPLWQYQPPADLLQGRRVLVTGAGRGIGRTAALTFAQHGATVILLGRTAANLEAVYDSIENNHWPQAAIYPLDLAVATERDYQALADTVRDTFGVLDGLLHNAALLGPLKPVSQYDADLWTQVMQVNVTAPMLLTKALIPLLRAADNASVVFTSSSLGQQGRAHWGAYCVSKFATEGLMQTLADEEDGISRVRYNSLNPGGTRTAMRAQAFPAEDPTTCPPPETIMPLYLYLMGPDSSGINGHAFHAQPPSRQRAESSHNLSH